MEKNLKYPSKIGGSSVGCGGAGILRFNKAPLLPRYKVIISTLLATPCANWGQFSLVSQKLWGVQNWKLWTWFQSTESMLGYPM